MNLYYFGYMLNMASVFMTAGTGAAISMRCGEFNLGGEGQIYAGGFICALLLAKLNGFPPVIAVTLSLLSGAATSALLSFISAFLKKFKNASFLLTSFIISSAVIPLINGLIAGPCRGNTGNLLATPFIGKAYRFTQIMKPSNLNPTFFIGFLICIAGGLLLFKTNFGRKLCVYGISNEFANYSGFSEKAIIFNSALISGGLHGLAGGFLVCGTYFTCHSGFYAGLGWSSLSASMLGLSNPLLVIPSSLFLGFVNMLTTRISLRHNVGFDLGTMIQSVIMFLISIPFYTKIRKSLSLRGEKRRGNPDKKGDNK